MGCSRIFHRCWPKYFTGSKCRRGIFNRCRPKFFTGCNNPKSNFEVLFIFWIFKYFW